MRHTLLLCFCLFMVFSCSESSLSDSFANDEIEFRKIKVDCDVKFEAGNALDIFGANFVFGFEPGWKGSFERSLFPCPEAIVAGNDCCNGTVTTWVNLSVPFSTTCNEHLDEAELASLYAAIQEAATANPPDCPDGDHYTMQPVAYDIVYDKALCCVYEPPCTEPFVEPCECYDEFPDSDYWGCCESYSLFLYVKYAYNGACLQVG